MNKFRRIQFDDDIFSPFEVRDNSELLKKNLSEIDEKNIRQKYKSTGDPISYALDSMSNISLGELTKDFIQEGLFDIVSFISKFVKN